MKDARTRNFPAADLRLQWTDTEPKKAIVARNGLVCTAAIKCVK